MISFVVFVLLAGLALLFRRISYLSVQCLYLGALLETILSMWHFTVQGNCIVQLNLLERLQVADFSHCWALHKEREKRVHRRLLAHVSASLIRAANRSNSYEELYMDKAVKSLGRIYTFNL